MRPEPHQSLTIDDFIALANLADPNLNLPSLSTFYQPGYSVAEGTAAFQAFMEELKGTPFHDRVWDVSPEQMARNYETVRSIRETLRELARGGRQTSRGSGHRWSQVIAPCPTAEDNRPQKRISVQRNSGIPTSHGGQRNSGRHCPREVIYDDEGLRHLKGTSICGPHALDHRANPGMEEISDLQDVQAAGEYLRLTFAYPGAIVAHGGASYAAVPSER